MKRREISLIFTNTGIQLKKYLKIHNYPLTSVNNYKVINSQKFIQELIYILKRHKINTRLINDNITIYIDNTYGYQDKLTLEVIFKELSFNKIQYINWLNKLESQESILLINISHNVSKIYYGNKAVQIPIIYNHYAEILSPYIKIILEKYPLKSIRLFGENESIFDIREQLERYLKINVYVYSNPKFFPFSNFL